MRIRMCVALALLVTVSLVQSVSATPPPGAETAETAVNSQDSLAEAVGRGFPESAWEYPAGLLPMEFSGLTYVSGPSDPGLSPKARWRRPIVLKDESASVTVSIHCYRRREEGTVAGSPGTPFAPRLEPSYDYQPSAFHGLKAATAAVRNRDVSVFRDGDLLFKVETSGGNQATRRDAAAAVVEAIWKFRHEE